MDMKYTINRKPEVAVVMVTYGDRFLFLNQVVQRLDNLGFVKYIVLVDNLVTGKSIFDLKQLKLKVDKLITIEQGYNSGSAKGFKKGIKTALDLDIDFIWLLDDDNLPAENALDMLICTWNAVGIDKSENLALLSFRPDRSIFKKAIQVNDPNLILGSNNSFLGFHIVDKIYGRKLTNDIQKTKSLGKVSVAPYGGLFFHKDLVKKIGLPDERYFLYGDDYDYTYRITKQGGQILLNTASVVKDLEQSFHLKKKKGKLFSNKLIKTDSKNRIFYSTRNGIIFEQNFVNNKPIYLLNAFLHIMLTLVVLALYPKHLWKYKYYLKGIRASL